MSRIKLTYLLVLGFLVSILYAVAATAPPENATSSSRPDYAGDASCVTCHKNVSLTYSLTSHHSTSQPATPGAVLGSFRDGANLLTIVDPAKSPAEPGLRFAMEANQKGFFETVLSGWGQDVHQRSERLDVVTGSGVRGQTYLYWQGDQLFELPVSYWTDGQRWINSPGYLNGTANFSRPVHPACLECHITYIHALSTDLKTNRYDRGSLVYGISCESCHGPSSDHVRRENAHEKRADSAEHAVLNPAKFSRDRQIDLCAECHNGIQRESLKPAFSYVPGRPLSDYFKPLPTVASEHPDVHGNQVGLLERSKCYLASPQMSCSTCHDVHAPEQTAASYSSKCLSCHQWQSCGRSKQIGASIAKNCIDCHMPVEPTNVIVSQTAGETVRATMRNHWIKIYPEIRSMMPAKAAETGVIR